MANKLLVEGLDWGIGDAALRAAFAPFGRVVAAKVTTDWETGRSRGFGHVTYDDETSARLAIETMDGTSLSGKVIRVMESPQTGKRTVYRGGDYGRTGADAPETSYRGGDYSDSRKATRDARVYRSADFGYADGPTKKSTYRAANFDGAGRKAGPLEPDSAPAESAPAESAPAESAPAEAPTAEDAPGATPASGPKRGGGHRDADQGWQRGGANDGIGDSGKTFG